jgi:hypothetical protein
MRASVLLFTLLPACTAGVEGLESLQGSDAGQNARDAGLQPTDAGGVLGEVSVFEPKAEIRFDEARVLVDPVSRLLQGDRFEIAFGGEYLFVWLENVSGRLFIVSAVLDPETGELSTPVVLSPEYEDGKDAPQTLALVYHFNRYALAWSTEDAVYFRALDHSGVPLDPLRTTWQHRQGAPLPLQLLPSNEPLGLVLIAGHPSTPNRGFALPLTLDGGRTDTGTTPRTCATGLPALTKEAYSLAASLQVAAGSDRVFFSRFNRDFGDEETRLIYTSDTARAIYLGPASAPSRVGVWDIDRGTILINADDELEQLSLAPPGFNKPAITHHPELPRLVLVHEAGRYRDSNPLPTQVEAEAFDYISNERSSTKLRIYDGTANDECIERVRTAIAGDRLGVGFITGCSARRLRFVELRAEGIVP